MMHSAHGDIHEIGLQDNCSACEEHAENPFSSLDDEMLDNLIRLTLDMRMCPEKKKQPRSENEAIARAQIMNTLERTGKMLEVMQRDANVGMVLIYFERFWRIEF
jgi:hypothetical protein